MPEPYITEDDADVITDPGELINLIPRMGNNVLLSTFLRLQSEFPASLSTLEEAAGVNPEIKQRLVSAGIWDDLVRATEGIRTREQALRGTDQDLEARLRMLAYGDPRWRPETQADVAGGYTDVWREAGITLRAFMEQTESQSGKDKWRGAFRRNPQLASYLVGMAINLGNYRPPDVGIGEPGYIRGDIHNVLNRLSELGAPLEKTYLSQGPANAPETLLWQIVKDGVITPAELNTVATLLSNDNDLFKRVLSGQTIPPWSHHRLNRFWDALESAPNIRDTDIGHSISEALRSVIKPLGELDLEYSPFLNTYNEEAASSTFRSIVISYLPEFRDRLAGDETRYLTEPKAKEYNGIINAVIPGVSWSRGETSRGDTFLGIPKKLVKHTEQALVTEGTVFWGGSKELMSQRKQIYNILQGIEPLMEPEKGGPAEDLFAILDTSVERFGGSWGSLIDEVTGVLVSLGMPAEEASSWAEGLATASGWDRPFPTQTKVKSSLQGWKEIIPVFSGMMALYIKADKEKDGKEFPLAQAKKIAEGVLFGRVKSIQNTIQQRSQQRDRGVELRTKLGLGNASLEDIVGKAGLFSLLPQKAQVKENKELLRKHLLDILKGKDISVDLVSGQVVPVTPTGRVSVPRLRKKLIEEGVDQETAANQASAIAKTAYAIPLAYVIFGTPKLVDQVLKGLEKMKGKGFDVPGTAEEVIEALAAAKEAASNTGLFSWSDITNPSMENVKLPVPAPDWAIMSAGEDADARAEKETLQKFYQGWGDPRGWKIGIEHSAARGSGLTGSRDPYGFTFAAVTDKTVPFNWTRIIRHVPPVQVHITEDFAVGGKGSVAVWDCVVPITARFGARKVWHGWLISETQSDVAQRLSQMEKALTQAMGPENLAKVRPLLDELSQIQARFNELDKITKEATKKYNEAKTALEELSKGTADEAQLREQAKKVKKADDSLSKAMQRVEDYIAATDARERELKAEAEPTLKKKCGTGIMIFSGSPREYDFSSINVKQGLEVLDIVKSTNAPFEGNPLFGLRMVAQGALMHNNLNKDNPVTHILLPQGIDIMKRWGMYAASLMDAEGTYMSATQQKLVKNISEARMGMLPLVQGDTPGEKLRAFMQSIPSQIITYIEETKTVPDVNIPRCEEHPNEFKVYREVPDATSDAERWFCPQAVQTKPRTNKENVYQTIIAALTGKRSSNLVDVLKFLKSTPGAVGGLVEKSGRANLSIAHAYATWDNYRRTYDVTAQKAGGTLSRANNPVPLDKRGGYGRDLDKVWVVPLKDAIKYFQGEAIEAVLHTLVTAMQNEPAGNIIQAALRTASRMLGMQDTYNPLRQAAKTLEVFKYVKRAVKTVPLDGISPMRREALNKGISEASLFEAAVKLVRDFPAEGLSVVRFIRRL